MQFSIRGLLLLTVVMSVVIAFATRRPAVTYHTDILAWHVSITAMPDGQPECRVWKLPYTGGARDFVHYYDEDRDGVIDYRHEIQDGAYIIHSYDDDHDGFFDRQRYWYTGYHNEHEIEIRKPVPKVSGNEP